MTIASSISWYYESLFPKEVEGVLRFRRSMKEVDVLPWELHDANFHFYIGQLKKNRYKGVYNDDFLRGTIASIFKILPQTSKFTIIDASQVWGILNDDDENIEDSWKYMREFVAKNFPKYEWRIRIQSIAVSHKKVLDFVGGADFSGDIQEGEELQKSSLQIFKTLAKLYQIDKKFQADISRTIPKAIKDTKEIGKAKYYGIVEVAVRLHDFLSWVTTQWGFTRQFIYDGIIQKLLMGEYKQDIVKNMCETWALSWEKFEDIRSGKLPFQTLHFDTKKFWEQEAEVAKARGVRNKSIAWVIGAVAMLVTTHLGVGAVKKYTLETELETELTLIIKKGPELCYTFKGPPVCVSPRYVQGKLENEAELKWMLRTRIKSIASYFKKNYLLGKPDVSDAALELMVSRTIHFLSVNLGFNSIPGVSKVYLENPDKDAKEFIERYFFPHHLDVLQSAGVVSTKKDHEMCFWRFCNYIDAFENTYLTREKSTQILWRLKETFEISLPSGVPYTVKIYSSEVSGPWGIQVAKNPKRQVKVYKFWIEDTPNSLEDTQKALKYILLNFYSENFLSELSVRFQFLFTDSSRELLEDYLITSGRYKNINTLKWKVEDFCAFLLSLPEDLKAKLWKEMSIDDFYKLIGNTATFDLQWEREWVPQDLKILWNIPDTLGGYSYLYCVTVQGKKVLLISHDFIKLDSSTIPYYGIETATRLSQIILKTWRKF